MNFLIQNIRALIYMMEIKQMAGNRKVDEFQAASEAFKTQEKVTVSHQKLSLLRLLVCSSFLFLCIFFPGCGRESQTETIELIADEISLGHFETFKNMRKAAVKERNIQLEKEITDIYKRLDKSVDKQDKIVLEDVSSKIIDYSNSDGHPIIFIYSSYNIQEKKRRAVQEQVKKFEIYPENRQYFFSDDEKTLKKDIEAHFDVPYFASYVPIFERLEESISVGEKLLNQIFGSKEWYFEGIQKVDFFWIAPKCVVVYDKFDAPSVVQRWSRIHDGIKISEPIWIGVDVATGSIGELFYQKYSVIDNPSFKLAPKISKKEGKAIAENFFQDSFMLPIFQSQTNRKEKNVNEFYVNNYYIEEGLSGYQYFYKGDLLPMMWKVKGFGMEGNKRYLRSGSVLYKLMQNVIEVEDQEIAQEDILVYKCTFVRKKSSQYMTTLIEIFVDTQTGEVVFGSHTSISIRETEYLRDIYSEKNNIWFPKYK